MANLPDKEKGFIEEVGTVFEQTGLPRMAGRIFGWLLISDPPHQSPAELAEALQASKGSISTMLRLLGQIGLIEQYMIPGERHGYYRLHPNALRRTMKHGLEDEIRVFHQLAEHGLELMRDEPSIRRELLQQMHDRYSFLEKEFPALLERYEKTRAKTQHKLLFVK